MKDTNATKATALIAIISFITVAIYKGSDFQKEVFDTITLAVSITAGLRYIYVKWAWKWHAAFEKIHSVPCLEGLWVGTFKSTWQSTDSSVPSDGSIETTITQPDLFTIKVTQQSGESCSYSFAESFERVDGNVFLNFSYRNEPRAAVRERSQISYGTSRYKLEKHKNKMTLVGSYYTDRKTTGDISLDKTSL